MKKYSNEIKVQILEELKQVASVETVARKHQISDKTIHNWLRAERNKDVISTSKSVHKLGKIIADRDRQIMVLKALLKNIPSLRCRRHIVPEFVEKAGFKLHQQVGCL